MKKTASLLLRFGLLMAAVFVLMSCSFLNVLPKKSNPAGPGQPAGANGGDPSIQASSDKTVLLPDTSAGLVNLKAYHAVLQIEATGSLDGKPFKSNTRVEITRSGSGDFDNQVLSTGGGSTVRLMTLGGAYYRWTGTNSTCRGSIDPPAEDEVIEPAALLLPLGAASRVGVDTVNQITAVHYRFDQSALPHFKSTGGVSGEVWVAENGGYVLRYHLDATAPQKLTGKGLEVSQTYQYELTPDSPPPALPKDCAPVPVDMPVIDGAQNITYAGGQVVFDTSSKPGTVIDFYEQKLPALGWKPEKAAPSGEITLPIYYDFNNGGLRLTVYLSTGEEQSTAVTLIVANAAAQAADAPHPTQVSTKPAGPLPTIDPANSGLPSNVPLYPGATSLMQAGGAVMFTSTDPWQDVAGYYRKQLPALDWTAGSEQPVENGISMIWNRGDQMLILTIITQDGQTQIVVSLPQ